MPTKWWVPRENGVVGAIEKHVVRRPKIFEKNFHSKMINIDVEPKNKGGKSGKPKFFLPALQHIVRRQGWQGWQGWQTKLSIKEIYIFLY